MSRAFLAVASVFALLLIGLLIDVILRIPPFAHLWLTQTLVPNCELPSRVVANAGALVALDVRQSGAGDKFASQPPSAWAVAAAKRVQATTTHSRDLVVYVHGFRTTLEEARCIGDNIRVDLATLPRYQIAGPDVVVFGWPGELKALDFGEAQRNAASAGVYLGQLLTAVADRHLYLIAHSLGAKVTMESVSWVPEIEGILLAQGAIRATSIRTWTEKVTIRHPVTEALPRSDPRFTKPIEVDEKLKTGRYVDAAARAKHLVVTVGERDAVLARAYSLNAVVMADDDGPSVPPWIGEALEALPQNLAIGSPFPSNPVYRRYDQPFPNPLPGARPRTPTLAPRPGDTLQTIEWCYWFTVPHVSFHELTLTGGPFLSDDHSALTDPSMRRHLLTGAWSAFTSPNGNKPPAGLAGPSGIAGCLS